jgi:pyruvate dehydrogenase E1 component beta subunit
LSELTFVQACNAALRQELTRDPNVFLLGEDIAHYGGMFRVTENLLAEFGDNRVLDMPISESGFIGMALGAALAGKRPIAELMFVDFSLVAMDQLLNQVAKTHSMSGGRVKVPLTIITQGGGYKGAAAQHSQMLEALFLHVPGLKVVMPSNPADAKGLLAAAIRDDNPTVFIGHKQLFGVKGPVPETEHVVPLGKANILLPGSNLTLISYSYSCALALEAAQDIEGVEVLDLRTLNPLDWETISASVSKTHKVLIVHEAHRRCGVGVDLAAEIQLRHFDDLDGPVQLCAALDAPIPFAKSLEDAVLPTKAKIVEAIKRTLNG